MDGLLDGLSGIASSVSTFVSEKPITTAVVGAGIVGAGAIGIRKIVKKRKKAKKTIKKKAKGRKLKFGSPAWRKKYIKKGKKKLTPLMKRRKKIIARPGRQTPYTARGGKDRSTRRIRMTKHGQPYIILKSGKARFIKKSSAKRSRKTKGGRY